MAEYKKLELNEEELDNVAGGAYVDGSNSTSGNSASGTSASATGNFVCTACGETGDTYASMVKQTIVNGKLVKVCKYCGAEGTIVENRT